jgi:hypothetical protein
MKLRDLVFFCIPFAVSCDRGNDKSVTPAGSTGDTQDGTDDGTSDSDAPTDDSGAAGDLWEPPPNCPTQMWYRCDKPPPDVMLTDDGCLLTPCAPEMAGACPDGEVCVEEDPQVIFAGGCEQDGSECRCGFDPLGSYYACRLQGE